MKRKLACSVSNLSCSDLGSRWQTRFSHKWPRMRRELTDSCKKAGPGPAYPLS